MNAGATLSEPVQDFFRIELQFRTDDYDAVSVSVLQPSSAEIPVIASCAKYVPGVGMLLKTKAYVLNGTSVETQQLGSSYACGQLNLSTGEFQFGDFLTVTKVVGWR